MKLNLRLPVGSSRKLVAIEYDCRCVRVVAFRPSPNGAEFDLITTAAMPEGVDLSDAGATGEAIGKIVADLGLSGARAVMNVPREKVVLRPLSLPPGAADTELTAMVRFQIAKELPFPVDSAVVDYLLTSHCQIADGAAGSEGRGVLAVAAKAEVAEFYRQVASAAGLRLVKLGLRPEAVGRCLGECVRREADECVALVNLTADQTEIDVFIGSGLAFSRSVPVGMPDRAVWPDERRPAVAAAVREVLLSIQSFQAVHPEGAVGATLVAGDTGLEDEIVASLSDRLSGTCEIFTPGRALGLPVESNGSAHAALLGAALAYSAEAGAYCDFLNPKRPIVQRDGKRDKVAGVGMAVLVLLTLFIGGRWWYLDGLRDQSRRLSAKVKKAETERKVVDKLGARISEIEQWQNNRFDWLGHWAQLSAAFPPADEVYITGLVTGEAGVMKFTVRAKNRSAIKQIEERLDALDGFKASAGRILPKQRDSLNLGYVYESAMEVRVDRDAIVVLAADVPGRPDNDGSVTLLPQKLQPAGSRSRGRRGGRR